MQSNVGQTQTQMANFQAGSTQTNPINPIGIQPQTNQTIPENQQQGQNVSIPNYSGVNIQIYNPSVGTPGSNTSYNVNAPTYPMGNQPYYGPEYYTGGYNIPKQNCECTPPVQSESDVNKTDNQAKTTKKNIIILTDEYIKNLETYLNSQDKEVRMNAASQVIDRLSEDESRKDDAALNILIDKMLQDPSSQIRTLALSALEGGLANGDAYTVDILKNIENSKDAYGIDSLQASDILLKMSGRPGVKEVEVKEKDESKKKS